MQRLISIWVVIGAMMCGALMASAQRAELVLVKDGAAKAAIYVAAEVMVPDVKPVPKAWQSKEKDQEALRVRLRESVNDLARYLEKISGAKIPIVTGAPEKEDQRLPILIGDLAVAHFGPPARKAPAEQGFRLVIAPRAVGLIGESHLATSYAIYELLERLGCRWYLPSDMGEVIPTKRTITLRQIDESLAPTTAYRGIWFADDAFKRRTRQGGLYLAANHALEISNHIPKEQLLAHPEWCGFINGKRQVPGHRYCWTNAEAAAAVADGIIAKLDKEYKSTVSLSPDDGPDFCECAQCKAMDEQAGDWDPSMHTFATTDRFLHFANQIVARVTQKYPDVQFGFLAYGSMTRPPVREKPHPNLIPQIAPITYCRAHSLLQAEMCPSRASLRQIVEGWKKVSPRISYYNYMFHLAEVTAPYPMMRQMSEELPVLFANGVTYWQPETLPIFETNLPGMVLVMRLSWDTAAKPAAVLDEFFGSYYGAAAKPMRRYWQLIDDAWTTNAEHAGSGFGYPRRFPPALMKTVRAAMNDALAACTSDVEIRRVNLHDEALQQFEQFMKMRWDLFEGRLAQLGEESNRYLDKQAALMQAYDAQYAFAKINWSKMHTTLGGRYFQIHFQAPYLDASRIAKDYLVISPPVRQWRYQVDAEKQGEALGWQHPAFNDRDWKTTDASVDTWSHLGYYSYLGAMCYRATVKAPAAPAGKKVYLWIASTDGSAKVFVNGRHIPYVNAKGETAPEAAGYCQPFSFEITQALTPGADNQLTIFCTRASINELGSGGLMGPVYLYQEKP